MPTRNRQKLDKDAAWFKTSVVQLTLLSVAAALVFRSVLHGRHGLNGLLVMSHAVPEQLLVLVFAKTVVHARTDQAAKVEAVMMLLVLSGRPG